MVFLCVCVCVSKSKYYFESIVLVFSCILANFTLLTLMSWEVCVIQDKYCLFVAFFDRLILKLTTTGYKYVVPVSLEILQCFPSELAIVKWGPLKFHFASWWTHFTFTHYAEHPLTLKIWWIVTIFNSTNFTFPLTGIQVTLFKIVMFRKTKFFTPFQH